MKYRADIDGLRALAVIPVVLFHFDLSYVKGGFTGVDVFFTISGYVITARMLEDIAANKFTILGFYERRIRRIIPALLFTMALCTVFALVFFLPPALNDFSQSLIAASAFVSNVYFWNKSGYFDINSQLRPLLHTWSLSVEEQFYLFIPIAMVLAQRLRNYAAAPIALLAAASFALSIFAIDHGPSANFYLLPTRAWELLAGSLIALAQRRGGTGPATNESLGFLGLALILFAIFFYDETTPFPGWTALPPVLGAALLIFSGSEQPTMASRILSLRPLVFIGLISYSLYLVHWPVAVFVRYYLLRDPSATQALLSIALSVALAVFSWRFVERPFRHPLKPVRRPLLFAGTGACLALAMAVGLFGVVTKGFRFRFPAEVAENVAVREAQDWRERTCFLINQKASEWQGETCMISSGAPVNALLWGDSFAAHYVPGLRKYAPQLRANVLQYTLAGCPPIFAYRSYGSPNCHDFNQRVFEIITRFNIKLVVLSARWDLIAHRSVFNDLLETRDRLMAAGVETYFIGQSPLFPFDPDILLSRGAGIEADGSATWYSSSESAINARLRNLVGEKAFVDPIQHLCRGERCPYLDKRIPLFSDFGHFSATGSEIAVKSYFPLYQPR